MSVVVWIETISILAVCARAGAQTKGAAAPKRIVNMRICRWLIMVDLPFQQQRDAARA